MPKRPRSDRGADADSDAAVPFVTVDGERFYADRFYLTSSVHDRSDGDNADADDPDAAYLRGAGAVPTSAADCACGARRPPPLLNRSRLVAGLRLRAALLATFCLDAALPGPDDRGGDGGAGAAAAAPVPGHRRPRPATSRWLPREFPALFGPDATVPTLVLHGQRRGRGRRRHGRQVSPDDDEASQNSLEDASEEEDDDEDPFLGMGYDTHAEGNRQAGHAAEKIKYVLFDTDDASSLCTQGPDDDDDIPRGAETDLDPLDVPSPGTLRQRDPPQPLPDSVYFTEVLSAFVPPGALASLQAAGAALLDADGALSDEVLRRRRPGGAGVHHAKYMLLLEQSGSLVVVVSTANLTRPTGLDACWVQRFPPATPTATSSGARDSREALAPAGLGRVLADFLQQQTLACCAGQLTPLGFLRRHLQWSGLNDLARRFDYARAQVHLVGTVPGRHSGRRRAGPSVSVAPILYGRQRVAQVLHHAATASGWLPRSLLSAEDRLLLQPTSLGADWNALNLNLLARTYLQHDDAPANDAEDGDTLARCRRSPRKMLLERMQILWPTHQWMHETATACTSRGTRIRTIESRSFVNCVTPSPLKSTSNVSANIKASYSRQRSDWSFVSTAVGDPKSWDIATKAPATPLFLSSKIFNTYELCILSQMAVFEPSYPEQRPEMLPPHIKTVARVFEGNEYALRQSFKFGKTQELFPWFLLTSASLSRGAQGKLADDNRPDDDAFSYANFELGVLFCSRLQGNKETDRLYCWKPHECCCRGSVHRRDEGERPNRSKTTRLIHLPVPYSLRPTSYQASPDDTVFCETPYFHEVDADTAGIGNMRLTPYGAGRNAKMVLGVKN